MNLLHSLQRLPYPGRAFTLLALVYAGGLALLLGSGPAGSGHLFLLAFTVLAAIFFGRRGGMAAVVLGAATVPASSWLVQTGRALPPVSFAAVAPWLPITVALTVLGLVTVFAAAHALQSVQHALEKAQGLAEALAGERELLGKKASACEGETERRLGQIRAAAEISRRIDSIPEPDLLLSQTAALLQERFGLYYVGVFTLATLGDHVLLRAAAGAGGQALLAEGHRLPVGGGSAVGWSIANRLARLAHEAAQFDRPSQPETRSELALPIISGARTLGAISVQSTLPEAFDPGDVVVLQGIADRLAAALENIQDHAEIEARLVGSQALLSQYLGKAWGELPQQPGQTSYTFEPAAGQPAGLPGEPGDPQHIPLVLRDQVIGELTLETGLPSLSTEDQSFAEAVTTQAALALENARLVEMVKRRARHEQLVGEIAARAQSSLSLEEIMRSTVRELGLALAGARVQIRLGAVQQDGRGSSGGQE